MFKRWFDRDLPAARAYDAAGLSSASNEDALRALRSGAFRRGILDEIIASLAAAFKPAGARPVRQVPSLPRVKHFLRFI